MKIKPLVCILTVMAVILIACLFAIPAFSFLEADSMNPEKDVAVKDSVASISATMPSEVAIYGEVKSVNAQANTMSIQYYDYDSDEEKTMELVLDKDTKIENAGSLADINQGNWVDIIYSCKDDKIFAKSIVVEKEEEAAAEEYELQAED